MDALSFAWNSSRPVVWSSVIFCTSASPKPLIVPSSPAAISRSSSAASSASSARAPAW